MLPHAGAAADDITPITDWASAERLGVAGLTPGAAAVGGQLALVIRGDVLRRYPPTVVHLARAAWSAATGPDGAPMPEPAGAAEKRPTFGGTLEPDVALVGFDLSPDDARGNATDPTGTSSSSSSRPTRGSGWTSRHPPSPHTPGTTFPVGAADHER
ncbi:hypothetical protein [Streptomyces avermitilis]|uniref:hypothetical protein n=1 Tax=Streptomyces avermitilis TaxID=33903 RepID=UPI00382EB56C